MAGNETTMLNNMNGRATSIQVSEMGVVKDLEVKDFTHGQNGFLVKNDGLQSVTLNVTLIGMDEEDSIETVFDVGWNPELVRSIRSDANLAGTNYNLKWGN